MHYSGQPCTPAGAPDEHVNAGQTVAHCQCPCCHCPFSCTELKNKKNEKCIQTAHYASRKNTPHCLQHWAVNDCSMPWVTCCPKGVPTIMVWGLLIVNSKIQFIWWKLHPNHLLCIQKKYPSTPCGIKWQLIGYPWLPKQDPPLGFGACSLLIQIFNSFDSHIGKLNPNCPLWKIPTGCSTEHFSPWISCYPKKALAHCQTRFQSHVKFTWSFTETSKVHVSGTLSIIQFDSHSCM